MKDVLNNKKNEHYICTTIENYIVPLIKYLSNKKYKHFKLDAYRAYYR